MIGITWHTAETYDRISSIPWILSEKCRIINLRLSHVKKKLKLWTEFLDSSILKLKFKCWIASTGTITTAYITFASWWDFWCHIYILIINYFSIILAGALFKRNCEPPLALHMANGSLFIAKRKPTRIEILNARERMCKVLKMLSFDILAIYDKSAVCALCMCTSWKSTEIIISINKHTR